MRALRGWRLKYWQARGLIHTVALACLFVVAALVLSIVDWIESRR